MRTFSACFEKVTTCWWLSQKADAWRALRGGAVLAGGGFARHQDEHLAGVVVAETHLADLPFRLAW